MRSAFTPIFDVSLLLPVSTAMQLFRAIPASRLADAAIGIGRQSTVRVHSNVPYVVDNLWESLRPKKMPYRRHAIYAGWYHT